MTIEERLQRIEEVLLLLIGNIDEDNHMENELLFLYGTAKQIEIELDVPKDERAFAD